MKDRQLQQLFGQPGSRKDPPSPCRAWAWSRMGPDVESPQASPLKSSDPSPFAFADPEPSVSAAEAAAATSAPVPAVAAALAPATTLETTVAPPSSASEPGLRPLQKRRSAGRSSSPRRTSKEKATAPPSCASPLQRSASQQQRLGPPAASPQRKSASPKRAVAAARYSLPTRPSGGPTGSPAPSSPCSPRRPSLQGCCAPTWPLPEKVTPAEQAATCSRLSARGQTEARTGTKPTVAKVAVAQKKSVGAVIEEAGLTPLLRRTTSPPPSSRAGKDLSKSCSVPDFNCTPLQPLPSKPRSKRTVSPQPHINATAALVSLKAELSAASKSSVSLPAKSMSAASLPGASSSTVGTSTGMAEFARSWVQIAQTQSQESKKPVMRRDYSANWLNVEEQLKQASTSAKHTTSSSVASSGGLKGAESGSTHGTDQDVSQRSRCASDDFTRIERLVNDGL